MMVACGPVRLPDLNSSIAVMMLDLSRPANLGIAACELPLVPWEAALGARVAVPTLGGTVELTIPAGTQSGQKLRLRGRGLPGAPNGDQFVSIKLVTPSAQSKAAKEAYERMKKEFDFDPRADWP